MRRRTLPSRATPGLAALLLPLLALAWAAPAPTARSAALAPAAAPVIVHDVDPAPYRPTFRAGADVLGVGGLAYFTASDDGHGLELWRTDGTPGSTALVRDIAPGAASSNPRALAEAGGALYFVADDGSSGAELWRSDGTAAGTALVRDIRPGPEGGLDLPATNFGHSIAALGDGVLFAADDGVHGPELWRSDGTPEGTAIVKDLRPGLAAWAPDLLTAAGAAAYFRTNEGAAGDTLWRSDGTAAGTVAVKSFPPAPFDSPGIYGLEAVGATLFVSYWQGLWRSDGTPAGTVLVDPAEPGPTAEVGGRLVYLTNGTQLKASDGTPGDVTLLASFESFQAGFLGVAGGAVIVYVSRTSLGAAALWRSDGTPAGTFKLIDVEGYPGVQAGRRLPRSGGPLLFTFTDEGLYGPDQLWYSDGTVAGTRLVHSVAPDAYLGRPAPVAGGWVFASCDASYACSLARSDGAGGAATVVEGSPLAQPELAPLAEAGGALFYITRPDPVTLWRSDGTPQGTAQVRALPGSGYMGSLQAVGPALYFTTFDGRSQTLWRSDGTPEGTGTLYQGASLLTAFQGALYFSALGGLYRSDGSAAGTAPVAAIGFLGPQEIVAARRAIFMVALGGESRTELWRSDGTPAGTRLVRAFAPISCGYRSCGFSTARGLVAAGDAVFFIGRADGGAEGLWRSDGTPAGTVQLTGRTPAELTAVGDALFFTIDDEAGAELWRSDGTPAGTARVRDILPGPRGSHPRELTAVDGALFFAASDGQSGVELWTSDGTPAGTRQVADLAPGFAGSTPTGLAAGGAALYFSAWSPGAGVELWTSDGTPAGTRQVADLAPGPEGSSPAQLTAAGGRLFFTANDGSAGQALWAAPIASVPYRPTRVAFGALIQAEDYDRGGEGVAYHDRDPQNRGGRYRPGDAVDLGPADGGAGGHLVGWTQAGEWLNYTVDVAATRVYTLEVRVAAQGQGGVFHIALDGEDWTGPLRVPDTGGWDRWATVGGAGLALPAGRHTLTLVIEQDGATWGAGNFDWIALRAPAAHTTLMPGVWR